MKINNVEINDSTSLSPTDYKLIYTGHKGKPLCVFHGGFFQYYKGLLKFVSLNDTKEENICKLNLHFPYNIMSRFRITERIARTEPRCAEIDMDGYLNISHRGQIITLNLEKKEIVAKHKFRNGVLNPLNIVRISGIEGFDDCLVYGEYWNNPNHEEVCIYAKYSGKLFWSVVYRFSEHTIRHIHNIIPDKKRKCVYILSGDSDDESGIWEARNNFQEVKPLYVGKQKYRSCVAMPVNEGIVFATDTPNEENGLYLIQFTDAFSQPELIANLPGPVIYGGHSNNTLIFSTTIEPDEKIRGIKSMFTRKLGLGIKDKFCHAYSWNKEKQLTEIKRYSKDILPPGLCQYGTVMFASLDNDVLMCPISVKNSDYKIYHLKL